MRSNRLKSQYEYKWANTIWLLLVIFRMGEYCVVVVCVIWALRAVTRCGLFCVSHLIDPHPQWVQLRHRVFSSDFFHFTNSHFLCLLYSTLHSGLVFADVGVDGANYFFDVCFWEKLVKRFLRGFTRCFCGSGEHRPLWKPDLHTAPTSFSTQTTFTCRLEQPWTKERHNYSFFSWCLN